MTDVKGGLAESVDRDPEDIQDSEEEEKRIFNNIKIIIITITIYRYINESIKRNRDII